MADIGVHAHEIGARQPLLVSAILTIAMPQHDALIETFDYARIVSLAEALAEQRIQLIETFARRLSEACLAHPAVLRAEIQVEKPRALANGLAGTRIVLEMNNPC